MVLLNGTIDKVVEADRKLTAKAIKGTIKLEFELSEEEKRLKQYDNW